MNKKAAIVLMSTILLGLIILFFNMLKYDIVTSASEIINDNFLKTRPLIKSDDDELKETKNKLENLLEEKLEIEVSLKILKNDLKIKTDKLDLAERTIVELKQNSVAKPKYDLSHLTQKTQVVWGPIQDDEAILLYGMVKSLRPKTLVEFGMGHGPSSTNFLKALDQDARMYTYDIEILNKNAPAFNDSRFKFIPRSQTEFNPDDFENRIIDFAYLDNGHFFEKEKILFPKLILQMSKNGIIVVHDTGLHVDDIVKTNPCSCDFEGLCGVLHCAPERQFVNWILDTYPEWQVINIHSFIVYRHGLTILQRKYKLSVEETEKNKCRYARK